MRDEVELEPAAFVDDQQLVSGPGVAEGDCVATESYMASPVQGTDRMLEAESAVFVGDGIAVPEHVDVDGLSAGHGLSCC